jgi:acyl-CoA synthetase (AMP-forming)/AMP-acid ligase II
MQEGAHYRRVGEHRQVGRSTRYRAQQSCRTRALPPSASSASPLCRPRAGRTVVARATPQPPRGIDDGWFRTGDIGVFDADGALRIVDRNKDLIIRGGYNFYPREIEGVLHRHPDVAQAAMFGVPGARMAKRSWRSSF